MANCTSCGKTIGLLQGNRGMCQDCFVKSLRSTDEERVAAQRAQDEAIVVREALIEAMLVSTETVLPDQQIQERLGIVTAECAYGMNVFKDFFAGVRNIVGGRSEAVQKTMRDARETVLYELKREANARGANAVIAVDLKYTQIGDGGMTMVLLIATGTAVVLARD